MRRDHRLLRTMTWAALGCAVALAGFMAGTLALFEATLSEEERRAWAHLTADRASLVLLPGMALAALAAALAGLAYRRHIAAPARLAEQARVLLHTAGPPATLPPDWPAPLKPLAQTINALARQREGLRADMAAQVARVSLGIEQERRRLAALMSELPQSVVVCNRDGRILLYNQRARWQFRTLSEVPQITAGAELLGIGRSVYSVFDRELVEHALERVQRRLQRGAEQPTAQFVTTTRSGQLLRAQLAPVRGVEDRPDDETPNAPPPDPVITGFVLMLDNITHEVEQGRARERLLQQLREILQSPWSGLKATAGRLDAPLAGGEGSERARALREDIRTLDARLQAIVTEAASTLAMHWPLEDMRGADLIQAAASRIEQKAAVHLSVAEVDPALWLQVDGDAVLQALCHLSLRVASAHPWAPLTLRLHAEGGEWACLDLAGPAGVIQAGASGTWTDEPMGPAGISGGGLSVREVVARHRGRLGRENEATTAGSASRARWRLTLPMAAGAAARAKHKAAALRFDRLPVHHDFDLFAHRHGEAAQEDLPLSARSFTIFDTETTGLDPTRDEILQIGAVRLINGKLLHGELFEQLVNPGRSIPSASIPIHGITDEMVRGQPTILEVLPAFHRYARDTVLVAHNAAFDMGFLQHKEAITGATFDQPVLDTLLLSEVVHPSQDSHRLEAIAERLGVCVVGRHTALGDAMVTAEVFRRLLPLLADLGIHTLAQAIQAAQRTSASRLRY